MRHFLAAAIAASIWLGCGGIAGAGEYPARVVTMIVPFPAGGTTDTLARFLAEKMRAILRQPVIIENVGGAAGSIGVTRAVRSAADGHTLSIGTSTSHMLTGGLYNLPFDLLKAREPIILIGNEPLASLLPRSSSPGMTTDRVARDEASQTFSNFCKQRLVRTSAGIGVSGKLVFQLVTPTSPT